MLKCLLLFLFQISLYSEENLIQIKSNQFNESINSKVYFLETKTNEDLSAVDLINLSQNQKLKNLETESKNLYYKDAVFHYLMRFHSIQPQDVIIYINNPYISDSTLLCDGKFPIKTSLGMKYPYSQRPILSRFVSFPIKVEGVTNCVLKYISSGTRPINKIEIMDVESFYKNNFTNEILYGLLYGVLFFAFINSIILTLTFRDKTYLLYTMYIFSMFFVITSATGDLTRVLEFFKIHEYTIYIGVCLIPISVLFNVYFTKNFFEIDNQVNKIIKFFFKTPIYIYLLISIISLYKIIYKGSVEFLILSSNQFALYCTFIGFISGLFLWRKSKTYIRFYLWSFLVIFMGVLASMLSYKMGYTATNANLFIYFSITTEIFLLSIALADKQRILELDKKLAQEKTIQIQREANESLEKKVVERTLKLQETNQLLSIEKEKSEKLILNILPSRIATELKENGKVKPRIYTASILFTDFHGFTKLSENLSPKELISELDTCFRFFDTLMDKYKLEKLKTIGDSFMCAGGIPDESVEHPFEIIKASLEMRDFIFERNLTEKNKLEIRIGIHIGKVIAGVIGDKKFTYDVWGDTVNTASRMESSGEIGKVNISEELYKIIKDEFDCMYRGEILAKNKGNLKMYFVENKK